MTTNDLTAVHMMLEDLSLDRGVAWRNVARAPEWVFGPRTVEVGEAACGAQFVKLFTGPWIGFRALGLWGEQWRVAKLLPHPKTVVAPSVGLAHRLTKPDSARRR